MRLVASGESSWEHHHLRVVRVRLRLGERAVGAEPDAKDVVAVEHQPDDVLAGGNREDVVLHVERGEVAERDRPAARAALTRGVQQAELAIAPSNPWRLYATLSAGGGTGSIYRSDDGGETWTVGTQDTIKWSSLNLSGNVSILLNRS